MHIRLVIDGTELHGRLDDTAAGRDFASLLPLTLTISDFHATEKISDLPRKLNIKGAPAGSEPAAGDITYYAPWGNLALFYRDFAYSDGLVSWVSSPPTPLASWPPWRTAPPSASTPSTDGTTRADRVRRRSDHF